MFSKKSKIITAVLFFLTVLIIASIIFFAHAKRKQKILAAADRGINWLVDYPSAYEDPGILWILKEVNDGYCQAPELEEFIKIRFDEFVQDPVQIAYFRLIEENFEYEYTDEALQSRPYRDRFHGVVIPALYCDTQDVS